MARFRSGTLERSVKRWGRMPNFGKFARKNHSWKYVQVEEQAVQLSGDSSFVTLIDAEDWDPQTVGAGRSGVRNVAFDLCFSLTWTPTSTVAFDSWQFLYGNWIMDFDDNSTTVTGMFGSQRALDWHMWGWNSHGGDGESGNGSNRRSLQRRSRFKARWLGADDTVQLVYAFQSVVTSTISDARVNAFGRVSWETP